MARARPLRDAVAWLAGMVVAGWVLWELGRLEGLTISWDRPLDWLRQAEPEVALAALARVTGLALVGWVVLSTGCYVLARLAGVRPGRISWLSIGPLRRAADALLAGSLVVSTIAPAGALVDPPHEAPPATSVESPRVDPGYVPVPAGFEDDREETLTPSTHPPATCRQPTAGPLDATSVVVQPGESLWILAERRLSAAWGRPVGDGEVTPYWVSVVAANVGSLRSGDPDLIFPGEEILLPAVDEVSRES